MKPVLETLRGESGQRVVRPLQRSNEQFVQLLIVLEDKDLVPTEVRVEIDLAAIVDVCDVVVVGYVKGSNVELGEDRAKLWKINLLNRHWCCRPALLAVVTSQLPSFRMSRFFRKVVRDILPTFHLCFAHEFVINGTKKCIGVKIAEFLRQLGQRDELNFTELLAFLIEAFPAASTLRDDDIRIIPRVHVLLDETPLLGCGKDQVLLVPADADLSQLLLHAVLLAEELRGGLENVGVLVSREDFISTSTMVSPRR